MYLLRGPEVSEARSAVEVNFISGSPSRRLGWKWKARNKENGKKPYCLQLRLGMTPSQEAISKVERTNWSGKICSGDLRIMTTLLPESITNQIRIKCCNPLRIFWLRLYSRCVCGKLWKLRHNQYNSGSCGCRRRLFTVGFGRTLFRLCHVASHESASLI